MSRDETNLNKPPSQPNQSFQIDKTKYSKPNSYYKNTLRNSQPKQSHKKPKKLDNGEQVDFKNHWTNYTVSYNWLQTILKAVFIIGRNLNNDIF
ncbi:hypothetical protein BpHYR1_007673 [Brachionus plicatilis]|uniref:Uncharacterized protein n=1 Tax=Brachionus plicatilis TaxID=10195 RepID=A0A3M7T447_BRAPC|nr:hypothetical protein BpHYR1_007673 [Brachionus plicatilis]